MVKITKKTTNVNNILQLYGFTRVKQISIFNLLKQNTKQKGKNMKNYTEIKNNEIINEVDSIMNTVSEEKLNEIRKKWEIFYEMFIEYGDMVYQSSCYDEISEDGYDINYILDDYDEKFESDMLVYDSLSSCLDTMYIMFDKNNHFYLINREKEEVYFIK